MDVGWRELPHTADLQIELWAPDEPELLRVGARAITAMVAPDGVPPGPGPDRLPVALDALDPADRLVRWLNEVLIRAVVEGFLTTGADLDLRDDGGLRGTLHGHAGQRDRVTAELKSVTYHDLELTVAPHEARARVVIDV